MTTVEVELPYPLRDYQLDAWSALARFSVLAWHRRGGKTVFAVKRLVTAALRTKKTSARYGYIAPYYRQAKEIAWGYLRQMLGGVPGVKFNESELQAELPNGARIRLYGADNPDSLRGVYFDGVVLDEVADMRPQVWGEIIRPALTDRQGWALFIGTPKGTNLFSERYYYAASGQDPDWHADMRRASETGAIPQPELDAARREMTPSQWAQEFDCDFAAAVDNVLVPLGVALEAQKRQAEVGEYGHAARILGVDVARYGDDRSVLFLRQGKRAFLPQVFRGLDLMTLAGHAARTIDEHHPDAVFVDQGGVGAGVVDRLCQLGYGRLVVGVDFGGKALDERFANRRAEMWWTLGEWVKTAQIPALQELVADLTGPTYTYRNAAGKLQLESKDAMKERGLSSPDLADALALTFAEPVASPGLRAVRQFTVKRAFGSGG